MENRFYKNHFDDKRKQKSSQSSNYYTNKWSNICSGNFSQTQRVSVAMGFRVSVVLQNGLESGLWQWLELSIVLGPGFRLGIRSA